MFGSSTDGRAGSGAECCAKLQRSGVCGGCGTEGITGESTGVVGMEGTDGEVVGEESTDSTDKVTASGSKQGER